MWKQLIKTLAWTKQALSGLFMSMCVLGWLFLLWTQSRQKTRTEATHNVLWVTVSIVMLETKWLTCFFNTFYYETTNVVSFKTIKKKPFIDCLSFFLPWRVLLVKIFYYWHHLQCEEQLRSQAGTCVAAVLTSLSSPCDISKVHRQAFIWLLVMLSSMCPTICISPSSCVWQ